MTSDSIEVEVAYATAEEQVILSIKGEHGLTVEQAILNSKIIEKFPEIDLQTVKVGIFGKASKKDAVLSAGDRVEIYRPLIADPKEARKKRAAEGKQLKKGGGASKDKTDNEPAGNEKGEKAAGG
ncbi:MAG: RnfH family protein [Chromatiales bacterium]|nr:RnfH family protein [Chromatiales bacterium]